jgi:hypothetical protein
MRFVGERRRGERREEDEQAGQGEIRGCLYLRPIAGLRVNTGMIPSVLSEAAWRRRMCREDLRALTPFLHDHVNPYEILELVRIAAGAARLS